MSSVGAAAGHALKRGAWRASTRRVGARALERRARIAWTLIGIAVLFYLPTIFADRLFFGHRLSYDDTLGIGISHVNFALVAVMGAVALNLLVGYADLISMGHSGFLAIGALGSGMLGVQLGVPFLLTAVIVGLAGGAIGVVAGLPSARVSGLYLLLSTLAMNAIIVYGFYRYQLAHVGSAGFIYPIASIGGLHFDDDKKWYYLLLVCAALTVLAVRSALNSREGRTFVALRDHENAATSVGINVSLAKLKCFALSSFIVSFAGVLYAYYIASASADTYNLGLVIGYYAMIIVGGMGSLAGSVLGAALWSFFPPILTMLSQHVSPTAPVVGNLLANQRGNVDTIVFGLLIIVLLILRPDGLIGIWRSLRASLRRWPYTT